jgi:acetyl-CoA carboxylase biotin carboxyl carrier protein
MACSPRGGAERFADNLTGEESPMPNKKESPKKQKAVSSILGVPSKDMLEYVKFFHKNKLKELTIKERGTTISLKSDDATGGVQTVFMQGSGPVPASQAGEAAKTAAPAVRKEAAEAELPADKYEKIASPITGTFYEAPNPGAEVFVKEGQTVAKGDTLCIIEAMKVMNKITAEYPCRVVKIAAKNGQAMKANDTLFLVEKA